MGQFIVIILGFLLGLSYPLGIEPLFFEPSVSLWLVGIITAAYLLTGYRLVNYYGQKILTSFNPSLNGGRPEQIIQTCSERSRTITGNYYRRLQTYRVSLLFLYAFEVYVCHWPLVVPH